MADHIHFPSAVMTPLYEIQEKYFDGMFDVPNFLFSPQQALCGIHCH